MISNDDFVFGPIAGCCWALLARGWDAAAAARPSPIHHPFQIQPKAIDWPAAGDPDPVASPRLDQQSCKSTGRELPEIKP